MSFFDRLDRLKESQSAKPEEKAAQAIPMPKLSFAEIDAMQQEKQEPVKRKPGRPPKVKA